ncbi:hypothetical protein AB6D75_21455 [Vibrio splendidus]
MLDQCHNCTFEYRPKRTKKKEQRRKKKEQRTKKKEERRKKKEERRKKKESSQKLLGAWNTYYAQPSLDRFDERAFLIKDTEFSLHFCRFS